MFFFEILKKYMDGSFGAVLTSVMWFFFFNVMAGFPSSLVGYMGIGPPVASS
jgi:hypothetical protein